MGGKPQEGSPQALVGDVRVASRAAHELDFRSYQKSMASQDRGVSVVLRGSSAIHYRHRSRHRSRHRFRVPGPGPLCVVRYALRSPRVPQAHRGAPHPAATLARAASELLMG